MSGIRTLTIEGTTTSLPTVSGVISTKGGHEMNHTISISDTMYVRDSLTSHLGLKVANFLIKE